jgi:hypothetical protein
MANLTWKPLSDNSGDLTDCFKVRISFAHFIETTSPSLLHYPRVEVLVSYDKLKGMYTSSLVKDRTRTRTYIWVDGEDVAIKNLMNGTVEKESVLNGVDCT